MEISRNLSEQPFSTGSGRVTLKNSLRDYFHLLKSPDFGLLVLKCAGFYSRVFTVYNFTAQFGRSEHLSAANVAYFAFLRPLQLI